MIRIFIYSAARCLWYGKRKCIWNEKQRKLYSVTWTRWVSIFSVCLRAWAPQAAEGEHNKVKKALPTRQRCVTDGRERLVDVVLMETMQPAVGHTHTKKIFWTQTLFKCILFNIVNENKMIQMRDCGCGCCSDLTLLLTVMIGSQVSSSRAMKIRTVKILKAPYCVDSFFDKAFCH